MKTVKEWFESIKDEDVRQRALANCMPDLIDTTDLSLDEALIRNIDFRNTPEGVDYWWEQYEKAINNQL